MQNQFTFKLLAAISTLVFVSCAFAISDQPADTAAAGEPPERLFAVEVRVGPNWDTSKPPNEQAFFGEHSANLRALREAGHIVMGARYSDIGLIVFSAESEEEIRGWMSQDPSMEAGTFKYEVHAMSVFFPGTVQP